MQSSGEKVVRRAKSSESDDSNLPVNNSVYRPWSPRLMSLSPSFARRGPKKYSHLRLSPSSADYSPTMFDENVSTKDNESPNNMVDALSLDSSTVIPNPYSSKRQNGQNQETSTKTKSHQKLSYSLPSPSSDARHTRSPLHNSSPSKSQSGHTRSPLHNSSPSQNQSPLTDSKKSNSNKENPRERREPSMADGQDPDQTSLTFDSALMFDSSVESRDPTVDAEQQRQPLKSQHHSSPMPTSQWNTIWGTKSSPKNGSPYDTRSIAETPTRKPASRSPSPSGRPPTYHNTSRTPPLHPSGGGGGGGGNRTPIFRVQTVTSGIEATLPSKNTSISTLEQSDFHSRNQLNVDTTMNTNDDEDDDFTELINLRQESARFHSDHSRKSSKDLLRICANIRTFDDVTRAEAYLTRCSTDSSLVSECVLSTDSKGRTPLHVFSENKDLAATIGIQSEMDYETTREEYDTLYQQPTFDNESNLERRVVRFLTCDLLASNPGAVIIKDIDGYIPFESALTEWVTMSSLLEFQNNNSTGEIDSSGYLSKQIISYTNSVSRAIGSTSSSIFSAVKPGVRVCITSSSKFGTDSCNHESVESSAAKTSATSRSTNRLMNSSTTTQPPQIARLTPHARFAIVMLSAVVDQLDHYMSPDLFKSRSSRVRNNLGCESRQELERVLRRVRAFRDIYGSVDISTVVVQTISTIPYLMRTILLLQDEGDREYLLSTSIIRRAMICKHSIGPWFTDMFQSRDRKVSQRSVDYLRAVSNEFTYSSKRGRSPSRHMDVDSTQFIDELSRLQDFIPALLALGDRGIEDASATFIVKKVLDRIVSRPFAVTVILCDALFLGLMLLGFRSAVNRLIDGSSYQTVLKWIYVCNTGIFYFVIREIGKTVSLFLISKKQRIYFFSFWNVIDILAVGLTLASTISMRYHVNFNDLVLDEESPVRGLLAITTGFLWLRVLSLLKAINMQLATFVLAIVQITKDITWFCVILLILVVSFGQMFFTLLAPSSCSEGDSEAIECKQSEYLLRVYTILLGDFGDFERENFTSIFSVFLVVLYSFLVTVVLLNVLIAVASDSYEKCLVRSQNLFGRARVMLIAELVSFQNLLTKSDSKRDKSRIYSKWWISCCWCQNWSRGSVLFLCISTLIVIGWTLAELLGYASGERYGSIVFSLASVVVNVLLFAAIMIFLAKGAASRKNTSSEDDEDVSDSMIQRAMLRLLGTSRDQQLNGRKARGEVDDWHGRVDYLKREMSIIVEEHSKSTEALVRQSESRLRAELNVIGENYGSLKSYLLDEVKESKSANAKVTMAVAELKTLISMAASTSEMRTPVPSEIGLQDTQFVRHDMG